MSKKINEDNVDITSKKELKEIGLVATGKSIFVENINILIKTEGPKMLEVLKKAIKQIPNK